MKAFAAVVTGLSRRLSSRFAGWSLQTRLVGGVLTAISLLWLLTALATWWDARHELDELLDAHLAQSASLLIAQQANGGDDDEQMDVPSLHPYARRVSFQVWHEGELVLRSPHAPQTPLSNLREGFETREIQGRPWRLFAARGRESDVQVYVGERLDVREDILWAGLRGLLGPLMLALPLIGLAVWWAVRAGLAPLRALGQVLQVRPPLATEEVRLPGATPPDLAPLLSALNGLLQRINSLLDKERRFTDAAAHELRTPIAAVRAQAQVALASQDDAQRRHALVNTLAGCDRAAHLVQQLLTLARLDKARPEQQVPLDLSALARQVAADLALQALDRQQELSVEAPLPVSCRADPMLLAVLLRNLLDNALRYSPDGAQVRIRTGQNAAGAPWLSVEDSGPGLAPQDLARLGERFFRAMPASPEAPDSAAAKARTQGSGLGWSIARQIAQAHGAELRAEMSQAPDASQAASGEAGALGGLRGLGGLGGLKVSLYWSEPPGG